MDKDAAILKLMERLFGGNEPKEKHKITPERFAEIRYHEAGHVIANILDAKHTGWNIDEANSKVTIEEMAVDGEAAAVTQSKLWTKILEPIFMEHGDRWQSPAYNNEKIRNELIAMGHGDEIKTWISTKFRSGLAGAAAQARFLKVPFRNLRFHNYGSSLHVQSISDLRGMRDLAGLAFDNGDDFVRAIEAAEAEVESWFRHASIWAATDAVANALKFGENDGKYLADVARPHLAEFIG